MSTGTTAFTADSSTVIGSGFTPGLAATILRMLGEYVITPTSAPTTNDEARVTVAIGVISADAVAANAAPDPGLEPDYPWLFWASHALRFASTATDPNSAGASVRAGFDIRSMRKMKPRETLIAVAEYEDFVGAPPLTLSWAAVRVLVAT